MEEDKRTADKEYPEPATPIPAAPKASEGRRTRRLIVFALLIITLLTATALAIAVRAPSLKDIGETYGGSRDGKLVRFDFDFQILSSGHNDSIDFIVAIPKTLDRRQKVLSISYDPRPVDVFDEGENRYAEFLFSAPEEEIVVSISGEVELFGYDLSTAGEMKNPGSEEDLARYLVSEPYLEKESHEIQAVSESVEGADEAGIVKGLFEYVVDNTDYTGYNPGEVGAEEAIERGGGDCSEYSDILVALCRARGIPAKTVDGFIVKDTAQGRDLTTVKHSWAEVYLQEYGWVPFDPTLADSGLATFEQLDPILLRVSDIRNNPTLNHGHFWAYHFWGDPIEVTESYTFTPQP